jgi:hypothetical protein
VGDVASAIAAPRLMAIDGSDQREEPPLCGAHRAVRSIERGDEFGCGTVQRVRRSGGG